ncbi:MAG: hypothetical protein A2148_06525 [Chloroflexi bacterium RBG_16_68_14]|nr:MAG: hypothetical protein A2148_06525 [Chloroflexi bacterium RBG_16_68_14]
MSDQPETAIPVLLVEDNEIDAEIAKRVLAKSGVQVSLCIARDGKEALDLLFQEFYQEESPWQGRQRPRLIVLDLGLPGFDGREVLRRIKNDPGLCSIPVAVLTGSSGEKPMLECMAIGGNMYFVKPMTVADAANVLAAVQQYWVLLDRLRQRAA